MKILEIELHTNDLAQTERFYSEVLGLELATKTTNAVSFIAGNSRLTFTETMTGNPKYHFAFNIPHNQLQDAIKWSSSRLELLQIEENDVVAHFESWNAKSIYFYDNNDNILEFIARFDLDNSSDQPFNPSSIESISEMGIVVDEPLVLAETIIAENDCFYFEKGARSTKFASLGNDHGLFVIVETNRKWFPTQHPAERHFTKVKLSIDGTISEITVNSN